MNKNFPKIQMPGDCSGGCLSFDLTGTLLDVKQIKFLNFLLKMTLNTERSYKRQGHAPLKHFVGFLCNGGKPE